MSGAQLRRARHTAASRGLKANLSLTDLAHNPERLARLRYYLAHRRPRQAHQSFWTFLLPKEEGHPMNKDAMQSTPQKLTSGAELFVYSNEHQTVLQLRQPPSETDPLIPCVQVGVLLTGPECLELASTLLSYAAGKVIEKPAPTLEIYTPPWQQ